MVSRGARKRVMGVTFQDPDPEFSAQMTQSPLLGLTLPKGHCITSICPVRPGRGTVLLVEAGVGRDRTWAPGSMPECTGP